jgi:hypothetical protein
MDGSIAMPSMGGGLGDDGRGSESGQSANSQLLRLVARANANVAELMRLSDYVPKIFYLEGEDARLYGPILQDYAYFQKADLIEEKMSVDPVSASAAASASASWSPSASGCGEPPAPPTARAGLTRAPSARRVQDLADRDEEMKAQYGDILQRFYSLFDSIYRYVQDFKQVRSFRPEAPHPVGAAPALPSLAEWTVDRAATWRRRSSSRTSGRACSSSIRWSRCSSTPQASS